jgi:superfamily II DNA or RNA helicase
MARYNIGDNVQSANTREKGVVVLVYPKKPGKQLYDVVFENGMRKPALESTLIPFTDYSDPFDCCAKGIYGSNSDFSCINTSYKIRNTSNNTISSLKASKTIFKAYQFKPLLKFLNSRNHRILIADEVGLGKTIEAGHIMLELSARRELNNALIVCPKSLTEKWQRELKEKFGFIFEIYSSNRLAYDIRNKEGYVRGIVNYEKIRISKNNVIFQALDESYRKFDFILCDEAHRLRNSETLAHRGMAHLLETPSAAVFLTATPVMTKEENLFNLLSLLDPEQYSDYSVFLNTLSINKPFIKAISALNANECFDVIRDDLANSVVGTYYTIGEDEYQRHYFKDATIEDRFKDSPLYKRIIRSLNSGKTDNETKVNIQFDLSAMSPMNSVFSRTRKREITTDWTQAERETHTSIIHLFPEELEEYNAVIEDYIDTEEEMSTRGYALGLIQRKRQISSSVYGYLNDTERLKNGIDDYSDKPDAKVDELVSIIEAMKKEERKHLIVFAVFKDTLRYLAIRLANLGYNTIQIHGDIDPDERGNRLQQFRDAPGFSILLSSEVGSEGLDMQFCNAMVNYDLPWNPMVVEQRIGRIDRFGQKSPKVHIYNLVVENSIQVDIYERLLDRIGIFKTCIGDLEAILDKELENSGMKNIQEWFQSLEKELYCNKLSEKERREKIDAIAKAIETEDHNLEEISTGLTNTLTNDTYFRKAIGAIDKYRQYVTSEEVLNFVRLIIEKRLPSCVLSQDSANENVYHLSIPSSQPKLLTSFLEENFPAGKGYDLEQMNRQFKLKVMGMTSIAMTFDQDTAYENAEYEFVTAYHPLVTAAYVYFEKNKAKLDKAFSMEIDRNNLHDIDTQISDEYFLGLFVLQSEKRLYGTVTSAEIVTPILYDISGEVIVDDDNLVKTIYAQVQDSGALYRKANEGISDDVILSMKIAMEEKMNQIRSEYIENESILIEANKFTMVNQYTQYYDSRIEHLKSTLQRHEFEARYGEEEHRASIQRVLAMDKRNIENMMIEKEEKIAAIQDAGIVEKEHKLISLSRITIVG